MIYRAPEGGVFTIHLQFPLKMPGPRENAQDPGESGDECRRSRYMRRKETHKRMEYILETKNLTKKYGQKEAAKDVNLHIKEGQIYGLIGRNFRAFASFCCRWYPPSAANRWG